jgi:hypothetical protein
MSIPLRGESIWFPTEWEQGTVDSVVMDNEEISEIIIRKTDGSQISLSYDTGETVTMQ